MFVRRFFSAWLSDWTGRMSGLASVLLALWAAFYTPDAVLNKWVLVALSVTFFIVGSYHIWATEHKLLLAEKSKHERFKLSFEVDEQSSSLSFNDAIMLKLVIRFENGDAHDWTMKRLDFSLYKFELGATKEVVILFSVLFRDYKTKQVIPSEQFEPMLIQSGRVTPYYEIGVFINVVDRIFTSFEDDRYLMRVSMEAIGQPIYERDYQLITNTDKTAALMSLSPESFQAFRRRIRRLEPSKWS